VVTGDQHAELDRWRRCERLAGDASNRVYHRVVDTDGSTAVLVEYLPETRHLVERDFDVLRWCRQRGLPVPAVLSADPGRGLAVVEDLGDRDAEQELTAASPAGRGAVMRLLLAPLESLAALDPDRLPPWNPPLDADRLRWELAGFELWYFGGRRGRAPSLGLSGWLDGLAAEIGASPRRVCHRDYHVNNVLIRTDGSPVMIDIQDLLVGPAEYDVVSLVFERAAADLVSDDLRRSILDEWAHRTSAAPGWSDRCLQTRVQRGLKVLGTFARLIAQGEERYRGWLERLEAELVDPLRAVGAPGELVDALAAPAATRRDSGGLS
jgi:aminoglycoside/choline kinase family phosphotransferase